MIISSHSTMESSTMESFNLPSLQSKMKCDPEGYESTLFIILNQFNSMTEIIEENFRTSFISTSIQSDPTLYVNLGKRAMFLAHVTPSYPNHLVNFPTKLIHLLYTNASKLPSKLRCNLTRSLVLLVNQKIVAVGATLSLFMNLQTIADKALKKLAFNHVVHSIKRMNQEHRDDIKNHALQNVLFDMLRQSDEKLAKRALVTLCELHRRKVWFDGRTANEICTACFHSESSIMIAALSFLLDYEKIEINDDSDDSSSDDELITSPQVILSNATIYEANYQGTTASKKKKRAKLHRIIRSMRKQQRASGRDNSYYSPLNHLEDAKGFAERLLKRLKGCERFEVRMMMLKLIARTVGLRRLILSNFYPFLQKYIQPHQRHVTDFLAMVVQACHDMVPLAAVEPLFKVIVNQFVHDRSQPEVITVGLNTVREICVRMPLLMNEDLLQDLALYKKSPHKSVSIAARSLIALFREVCPSLLAKKDRGRPFDPKARQKAHGDVTVPAAELMQIIDSDDELKNGVSVYNDSDNDWENYQMNIDSYDAENLCIDDTGGVDNYTEDIDVIPEYEDETCLDHVTGICGVDDVEDMENGLEHSEEVNNDENDEISTCEEDKELHISSDEGSVKTSHALKKTAMKRKFADYNGQFLASDSSLRALKKFTGTKMGVLSECNDSFLFNEDFQCVEAKREARNALAKHGLAKPAAMMDPRSTQLCLKRVDHTVLEAHVSKKLTKDERLALVRAGREERGKYIARAAVKQKKSGGLSNRQKEHKKKMPLAAKRHKIERHQIEKKKKHQRSGKQFRGRKAWK